eukprot:scaffold37181_cov35-Tisochrysis_lutea.AAC.2
MEQQIRREGGCCSGTVVGVLVTGPGCGWSGGAVSGVELCAWECGNSCMTIHDGREHTRHEGDRRTKSQRVLRNDSAGKQEDKKKIDTGKWGGGKQ